MQIAAQLRSIGRKEVQIYLLNSTMRIATVAKAACTALLVVGVITFFVAAPQMSLPDPHGTGHTAFGSIHGPSPP